MRKIYIDNEYKVHVDPIEGGREFDTDFFDGRCKQFIEGYLFVPSGETWTSPDGVIFNGEMITPFMPSEQLEAYQTAYEQAQAETQAELDIAYREGVNSI